MELKMALLLRRKPLAMCATFDGEPSIESVLPEAINFARAAQGEAYMLVENVLDHNDEVEKVKRIVETLIKALAVEEGELSAQVEKTHEQQEGCFCLKVTVTAK